ncbi:uncharacterized protein LTR77_000895 [Saxophila tyrrhenica]|uniref:FAD-binding domain-containing protein n=1 Tax=Saxophila tyrrhenica TaxID=1690608 RepID=A0AAV9PQK4_9PEZI|nr:hypothetical protein LTR77_000895 [Saxophila tyrrhenica]
MAAEPLNVLVSGSGIAGSVFAFWLLKAQPKANVTIVERAPSPRLTGASVDIRSSAVDIIKWMGMEPEIRANSTGEEGMAWVDTNGKPFATFRSTGRTDYQSMTSEYEIHRGTLAKIFLTPSEDKIKMIFAETVDHYTQCDDGKVDVTFTKSKDTKTYDLLVAADGLSSRIRGQMLNTKPREQIHDQGVHAAYFTIKEDLLQSRLAKWHNDTKGRVVLLRPDPDPAGRSRGHFINATPKNDVDMKRRLNNALKEGNEAYMDLMEELFSDAGWLAKPVLKAMRESDDFYCSLFAQVRSPQLQSSGNVVLLGDAGYATPGFGTSLAIMGGYVLAGELMNRPSDVQGALAAYESLMQPFVKKQQGDTPEWLVLNPQTAWGIKIRDTLLWAVAGLKLDRLMIIVSHWLGIQEDKLEMPSYPWPEEKMSAMRLRWLARCFITLSLLGTVLATKSSKREQWKPQAQKYSDDGKWFVFASRPDIKAPVWEIKRYNETALAPGHWLVAPYEVKTQEVAGEPWVGPHIYDEDGQLVWSGTPTFGYWNVFDFSTSEVDGALHLSGLDWHNQRGVVLDDSYRLKRTASSLSEEDTFQNMHGFHVVDDGAHALVQIVRRWNVPPDITFESVGYNHTCEAHYQGFREVDLSSDPGTETIFEFDGRKIGLNESTYFSYGPTAETMCKRGWDLLHVNAVDKCPDGDYLMSARHTDALYKISHETGDIVWRLGGVMSDFEFGDDAKFTRQHHARCLEQNEKYITVSLFDNAVGEHYQKPSRRTSRGLVLSLDLQKKTAEVKAQYELQKNMLTDGRGSFQMLPNGNAFVNWAVSSKITEHLPNGTVVMEARLKAGVDTYRAFKSPWVGRPASPPDVHSEMVYKVRGQVATVISLSWNGATEVQKWNVRGYGLDGKEVRVADGVPRNGFETQLEYEGFVTDVYVEAVDQHGRILSTSKGAGNVAYKTMDPDGEYISPFWITVAIAAGAIVGAGALAGYRYLEKRFRSRDNGQEKGRYEMVEQNEG